VSIRVLIEEILDKQCFAVTGVSRDPDKYGYKVYKTLKAAGYKVYPVNPNADDIDGDPCFPTLDNVPDKIDCVVTVTPPPITEETMLTAGHLKIPYVWMQPGSESTAAFNKARGFSMQIVSGGPCIMVSVRERAANRDHAA
jgi:predicted CoA-binding protein